MSTSIDHCRFVAPEIVSRGRCVLLRALANRITIQIGLARGAANRYRTDVRDVILSWGR